MQEQAVVIRMRVDEISKRKHWNTNPDGSVPKQTKVTLQTSPSTGPNDPNHPFATLSSGSEFKLASINESAMALFEEGEDYEITIRKVEKQ